MNDNHIYTSSDFFDSNSSQGRLVVKVEPGLLGTGGDLEDLGANNSGGVNSGTDYCAMDTLKDNPMMTTASMPIPSRGSTRMNFDFSDFGFDFDSSQDITMQLNPLGATSASMYADMQPTNSTMWSDIGAAMVTTKSEPFHMDDDDIFQVDKADLIQGELLCPFIYLYYFFPLLICFLKSQISWNSFCLYFFLSFRSQKEKNTILLAFLFSQ